MGTCVNCGKEIDYAVGTQGVIMSYKCIKDEELSTNTEYHVYAEQDKDHEPEPITDMKFTCPLCEVEIEPKEFPIVFP